MQPPGQKSARFPQELKLRFSRPAERVIAAGPLASGSRVSFVLTRSTGRERELLLFFSFSGPTGDVTCLVSNQRARLQSSSAGRIHLIFGHVQSRDGAGTIPQSTLQS